MNINLRLLLILTFIASLTTACNPLQSQSRLTRFDDVFKVYSKNLRWGHLQEVAYMMTEKHRAAALAKVPTLKDIRVSRVQATHWTLNEEKDRISGSIEISYYLTNRGVIRQTSQQQTWLFKDNVWLLDGGLPDLK